MSTQVAARESMQGRAEAKLATKQEKGWLPKMDRRTELESSHTRHLAERPMPKAENDD